jgi:hypothetical protein
VNYYTTAGPESGPILWRDDCAIIDVLRHPDGYVPIGMAMQLERTEGGIAIWDIILRGELVPGCWIVLGRQFLPKKGCRCLPPCRRPRYSHAMSFFAKIGPRSGPILGRHRLAAIGVLEARDDLTPVGMALALGRADDEVELWELTVRGLELPGRWIVVDREFHPAPESGRAPRG